MYHNSHCTSKFLNLEDVNIRNVIHFDSWVKIYVETKPSPHVCPACGLMTQKVHDYRSQTMKDLPFQMKHAYIILKKRRYVCSCGKRFSEKYSLLASYERRTIRLSFKIIDLLRSTRSIKSV